jgi:hypothetical protein
MSTGAAAKHTVMKGMYVCHSINDTTHLLGEVDEGIASGLLKDEGQCVLLVLGQQQAH